jgi:hypothetical protein
MKHNIDIKREHENLDAALDYLKQMGFINLMGWKIFTVGCLYATIGNDTFPVEVEFAAKDGDIIRLLNLMKGVVA